MSNSGQSKGKSPGKPPSGNDGKRVTVRDIARAAGVSHSTVSRALQGSPLVREERRRQLVELAEQMGYRPDPMLSALTAYRSRVKLRKQRDALAFVVGDHMLEVWEDILKSARQRAEKLGFDLQRYVWREDLSPARQSEILRTRGVRGIIIGPLSKGGKLIKLPLRLNYFSWVALGRFLSSPDLNTVSPNHFGSVRQAVENLHRLGYHRIGLALLERLNTRVHDRIRTAYLGFQANLPEKERIPICMPVDEESEMEQILDWYERERPEIILSYSHIHDHLVDAGIRVPDDVAFASLNLNRFYQGKLAGTDVNDQMVGQVAVNLLNSQLLVGEIGAPSVRQTLIVDTLWRDGPSAPALVTKTSASIPLQS